MTFSGAAEERFEVSVWPDQALVKYGQSLTVNCSTTCPDPGPGGIETLLKKTQVGKGPQWKEFLLEDVTQNSILQCFFSCAGIQKDINLGITVYREWTRGLGRKGSVGEHDYYALHRE